MTWLKKNLIFAIIMLLLFGVLGYEVYLILGERKKAVAAEAEFENKIEEHQKLSNKSILPHQRNVELTKEEIDRHLDEMKVYEEALDYDEVLADRFADYPESSTDALFDIQFFVEEYREKTAAATEMSSVDLANEFFGFQAYSQSGPESSLIPTVYKQRLVVAYILDRLFEAKPEELISVARPGEESESGSESRGRGATRDSQAGSAGFSLDPKLTAAISDVAETKPYQVTFTGRTSTLRTFVNELESYEMPLIVRSIEVVPASATGSSSDTGTSRRRRRSEETETESRDSEKEADENIPLVADNLSRFTVTMEFIDLVPYDNKAR